MQWKYIISDITMAIAAHAAVGPGVGGNPIREAVTENQTMKFPV